MAGNTLVKVTGLWKNNKNEKQYWSGSLTKQALLDAISQCGGTDKIKVMLFPNNQRPGKNDPELQLLIAPFEEGQFASTPKFVPQPAASPFDVGPDDDIPF